MKKFLVISAIALATFSAFCAGTKKFGKMKDSDWVVTNAWQAMQHRVKPDSEWATNHFGSAEFSNAVGKVQRKVDIPVKSVNGETGDVILNAADVGAVAISKSLSSPVTFNWNPDGGNEIRLYEPSLKVGIGIGLFLRGFGGELRNYHEGKYDWYHFPSGESGILALKSWRSLLDMLNISKSTDLAANQTFSNAVLAVGLNIDTNSVAVLNEIAETFGGFPLEGTATTVGGLLAALAAAVAWLKKNKVGLFDSVGGATATVDNGVAKLDNFFTNSNSLLTATIDARLPYPLYAVPSTGLLKDRAINTTSLDTVTVPDNFTDLLIRASVASSLSVTMPEAIATKYGDTFPGESGEYLITITKTGAAEAYVRTIKLEEVANA